ncbi:hypothetical protein P691DRAFT_759889 [Macrolepiota fuliginosa MF-IS2]|uniref:F-box domain-containing protein n=1 Tax=Macrolepiota fuliginosa MF-IS2 TaxID=1400762 RepID=A0A9P6C480_9AGAR|nr:hypothetical protein P691DRAFT_759889 [Macrolepiota fuliginosa MF-IS2]
MLQSARTTLTDLPFDILDVIAEILDESSLCTLAQASPILGQVVLQRVGRFGILERVSSHSELVIGPGAPVALVPALIGAFWIPSITALVYSVERNNEGHVLDDLRGISVFLSRIPYGSLQRLRVQIVFNYNRSQTCDFQRWGIPEPRWSGILERLFSAAISIGCSQIEIDGSNLGGWLFGRHYSPVFRDAVPRLLPYMKRLFIQFHYKPPLPTAVGTRSVTFNNSPFFRGLFLNQTIKHLNRCARTIQHLAISPTNDSDLDYGCRHRTWLRFSALTYLPYLKSLSLWAPDSSQMLPQEDLFQFLARHPNITFLNIDFADSQYGDTRQPVEPTKKEYPILPKLEILTARPEYIPWLISLITRKKKSASPLSLFGRKTHRHPLKSIQILTQKMIISSAGPGVRSLIEAAILSLNNLLPPSDHSGSESTNIHPTGHYPLFILQMNFGHPFWTHWLKEKAADVAEVDPEDSGGVSRITNLTLEIDDSERPCIWSPTVHVISNWLATTFPYLQNLEIVGQPFTDAETNEQLYGAIVERCRRLRRVRFDGRLPLWLDGEGEVQERHQI